MQNSNFRLLLFILILIKMSPSIGDNHNERRDIFAGDPYGVEMLACNYRDGKNLADLIKVTKDWAYWATKNNPNYDAWLLTPVFPTEHTKHAVHWLGTANSLGELMAVLDQWMDTSDPKKERIKDAFESVVGCEIRAVFRGKNLKPLPDDVTNEKGVAQFFGCSVNDGVERKEVGIATSKWTRFIDELGLREAHHRWWPANGVMGTDHMAEFDFINIIETDSLSERAENGAIWWEALGPKKAEEIFGELLSCNGWGVFSYMKVSS